MRCMLSLLDSTASQYRATLCHVIHHPDADTYSTDALTQVSSPVWIPALLMP